MISGLPYLADDSPLSFPATPRALAVYALYRRLRHVLVTVGQSGSLESLVDALLAALVAAGPDDPLVGGRAYRRCEDGFELFAKRGESGEVTLGYVLPTTYRPLADAVRDGWALVSSDDPRFDAALEAPLGGRAFAVVSLGPGADLLLAFTLREPVPHRELEEVLPTLRSIAELACRQRELVQSVEEARSVQTSLLATTAPTFPGFEVAFRSRPAMLVGGDLYDFRVPLPGTLALAVGDATGHGLPAALQARDAVVGLRMGWAQQLKLTRSLGDLAQVLHEGSSGRRFISLFAGELDSTGHLVYVNAGHPPPLHLRGSRVVAELHGTGPVMGLTAAPEYGRGFAVLERGETLVLYTDGIPETCSPAGEELGVERLVEWLGSAMGCAADCVEEVFRRLDGFAGGAPAADDQTLMLVRRVR
jgi:sigma-B regulation protein RsbU (phosphoserine phosphatase)